MKYRPTRLRRLNRVWINRGQPTYFITVCVANRSQKPLANDAVHTRLRQFLHNSAAHYDWWAGRYVLMPDHLHLLVTPGVAAVPRGEWMKALKAIVADRTFKWQTGFFDRVLRSDESESEKWDYICQNPVRAGLVATAESWPYAGEIDWALGDVDVPRDVGPVPRPGGAERDIEAESAAGIDSPPRQETRPPTNAEVQGGSASIELLHLTASAIESRLDHVATEEPLEIRIEGQSVAVVMRTPGHDRELAAGFLLTENLVRRAADIFDITQCGVDEGEVVNVTLRNPATFDASKLTRHVFSSSSCGVCSKATIAAVRQSFPAVDSQHTIAAAILLQLPQVLRTNQATFERTGGLHACALFDLSGNLQTLREDVGRHNALDKLIGHALLTDALPLTNRVLLLSGRVSFEMMQKALAGAIPIVAAISAPTTLAVEFARESNQTLVGFLRGETMNIYVGAERIAL